MLRYDDRGVAELEGDFTQATSKGFAEDAQAAVAFLQQHPTTSGKSIGLIGHSEGGMVVPMVASKLLISPTFKLLMLSLVIHLKLLCKLGKK